MAAISSPEADKGRQSLIGRAWRAERIGATAAMDRAPATLSFDAEGRVSGSGGCNRLSTSVQIDGSSLTFGAIATTRRMCDPAVMNQEAKFLLALERTRQFRVEGSRLVLLGRAGGELVQFAGGP
jgi:putative lipoprotein